MNLSVKMRRIILKHFWCYKILFNPDYGEPANVLNSPYPSIFLAHPKRYTLQNYKNKMLNKSRLTMIER